MQTVLHLLDPFVGDRVIALPAPLVAPPPGAPQFQLVGFGTVTAVADPTVANDTTQGIQIGFLWFNLTPGALRWWLCRDASAGAAKWAYLGAEYAGGGSDPAAGGVQFGLGASIMGEEGSVSRQIVSAGVQPGATGADNVLAVFSLPAGSLDSVGRGLEISANGSFGATANNKRIKIIANPATAVVGSTVGASGVTIADTGTVATNAGGWALKASLYKYGALNSNTQLGVNDQNLVGAAASALLAPALVTATENGAILLALTGNATTAVSDIISNLFKIRAMN